MITKNNIILKIKIRKLVSDVNKANSDVNKANSDVNKANFDAVWSFFTNLHLESQKRRFLTDVLLNNVDNKVDNKYTKYPTMNDIDITRLTPPSVFDFTKFGDMTENGLGNRLKDLKDKVLNLKLK